MGMTQRMSVLDAPTIEGGQDLHDGYLSYLIQLADISGGGAIAIDDAPDADSIAAIVEQIQFETSNSMTATSGWPNSTAPNCRI